MWPLGTDSQAVTSGAAEIPTFRISGHPRWKGTWPFQQCYRHTIWDVWVPLENMTSTGERLWWFSFWDTGSAFKTWSSLKSSSPDSTRTKARHGNADGPWEMQLEPLQLPGGAADGLQLGGHTPSPELAASVLPLTSPWVKPRDRGGVGPPPRPGLPPEGCRGEPGGPDWAGRGVPPCLSVKNKIIIIIIMSRLKSPLWLEGENNICILKYIRDIFP